MKGNLIFAIVAGVLTGWVCAGIWAAVTVASGYQIGWMAVGVGFLVGYAVRFAGKGSEISFSIVGAACALMGCVLGNLFSGIGFIAMDEQIPVMDAIVGFDYSYSFELLSAMFMPIDLLFYGIAIYEGFKFAIYFDPELVQEAAEAVDSDASVG